MSLTSVKMSEEVWMTCMTHSLSTETEEIMGLLLGDTQSSENGGMEALIWGASPQPRCDRKKDRVETNPEQLAAAAALADKMTTETGRTTRVIGWYHSHPHITVLPSHVDVRTQAMYQLLDSGFIGLIFSCFSEDMHKVGRIQVIAFQSLNGRQSQLLRAVPLSPINKGAILDLSLSSSTSENASARFGTARYESLEQDTADSKAIIVHSEVSGKSFDAGCVFANGDANYLRKEKVRGNHQTGSVDNALVDMDMSDSMQEALLRSKLEISWPRAFQKRILFAGGAAEYIWKEVPLHVLRALSILKLDSPLASYVDLQRVLFEEEKAAYNQAILQSIRDGKVHPLAFIHHTSTYQASLCKLMEFCLSPAINALQDRLRENESQLSSLLSEHQRITSHEENTSALVTQNLKTNKVVRVKEERDIITYQKRRYNSTNQTLASTAAIDTKKSTTICSRDDE